jgi:hypothetical protein
LIWYVNMGIESQEDQTAWEAAKDGETHNKPCQYSTAIKQAYNKWI